MYAITPPEIRPSTLAADAQHDRRNVAIVGALQGPTSRANRDVGSSTFFDIAVRWRQLLTVMQFGAAALAMITGVMRGASQRDSVRRRALRLILTTRGACSAVVV